jgi:long-chain acyl-CoA synthetase
MTDHSVWLSQYDSGQPADIVPDFTDMLALFRAAVVRAPQRPAALYFDGVLSFAELDRLSDALTVLLAERGFVRGDRLAIYLQNMPAYLIALVAAWKAGGIAVSVSPMNRERELSLLLDDCTPRALICHASLHEEVVAQLPPEAARPAIVLTTSALDFQTRDDPRLFAGVSRTIASAPDLLEALAAQPESTPSPQAFAATDPALLVYTSGTTGVPKGAILTHGSVAFNAQVYRDWIGLREGAPILALAPLFHVTGLVGHIAAAFLTASPLVLSYRFHAAVMLDSVEEHRPAFTIGAITAFGAMLHAAGARREQLESLERVFSGGAAIPPSIIEAFSAKFGHVIRNGYGLTETASPTHIEPLERPMRVDPASGALSIGVPVFNTHAWVAAEDGTAAPLGGVGEITVSGPMVSPGYWNKPEITAEFMRADGFRTGDIGFMDADGWFYLVDRKKDMINAGGYKVWPREVEDVLYTHPAVREAAVVGVPDAYRGETVKAVVSLKPGHDATPDDLAAWCKARMAAYKYPRLVEIRPELPKTPTGKILRRMLR